MGKSYLEVPKDTTYCEVSEDGEDILKPEEKQTETAEIQADPAVGSEMMTAESSGEQTKDQTEVSVEFSEKDTKDQTEVPEGSSEEVKTDRSEIPSESSVEETKDYSEVTEASSEEDAKDYAEVPSESSGEDAKDYSEVPSETAAAEIRDYSEVPSITTGEAPAVVIPLTPAKKFGPDDVGLVLCGGGGKGAYQIGVLRALSEGGVLKDVKAVSGTSIGAVNAVLYAQGDFNRAYKTWDDIDMVVLFDIDPAMLVSGRAIASREEMNRLMNTYVDYDLISRSELEIYCGVAEPLGGDQYRAEYMRLNGASVGEIRKILMATTALPVIYDTVTIGGRQYRDGGMADNEPIRPLYDAGIRRFIVIGLTAGRVFRHPEFSDAEFTVIDPVYDLGDVFSGTLNFHEQDKAVKRLLGYKDGKRAIKTKFEKDEHAIAVERVLAKMDYDEAVRQVQHERTVAQLERDISSRFDYISQIEKKWGGD